METLVEAMARLRALGHDMDLSAAPGGQLRCGVCGEHIDADQATIDEIVRFEGDSNPDDEAILAAVSVPSGTAGCTRRPTAPTWHPTTPTSCRRSATARSMAADGRCGTVTR